MYYALGHNINDPENQKRLKDLILGIKFLLLSNEQLSQLDHVLTLVDFTKDIAFRDIKLANELDELTDTPAEYFAQDLVERYRNNRTYTT